MPKTLEPKFTPCCNDCGILNPNRSKLCIDCCHNNTLTKARVTKEIKDIISHLQEELKLIEL